MPTVVPAYGRDYQTAEQAKADWEACKDFVTSSLDIGFGQYCSCRDFQGEVKIRFNKNEDFVIVDGQKN